MKYPIRGFYFLLFLGAVFFITPQTYAQTTTAIGQDLKAITTAVPILLVSPNARAAGMGDAGVATSPDGDASFWNAGKLGFVKDDAGINLSISPWLHNIASDMYLNYLSGYKRVNKRAAFAASMMYFDLGDLQFTDNNGNTNGEFSPKEYAFNLSYGQQLSDNLGLGVGARFIHSNLSAGFGDSKPGNSASVDVGIYYKNDFTLSSREYNVSFGGNISNIGAKIAYTNADQKDFLPTNLRLGTALSLNADEFNKFTLAIDANKLLVPTPNASTTTVQTVPGALFSSFGDAPGGFSEELQEVTLSTGLEYLYNDIFAGRVGYFYENPSKGDRHYLTMGLGLKYQKFGFDVAYLVPNSKSNPLAKTLRFTLSLILDSEEK